MRCRAKEGALADKSTQLVLDALSRALAEPGGLPLHGSKAAPGLFPTTPRARQAADRCRQQGYLHILRSEIHGKAQREVCALTEQGLAYLLDQLSPRRVLEDLVRALEARQAQVGELLASARQTQANLEALGATVEKVLRQLHGRTPAGEATNGNGSETWPAAVLAHLAQWRAAGASEDCPLPELYRAARVAAPDLTLGRFHDGLRHLHEHGRIYLHPWTGPLYDLPEPPCALLVGHEVDYYASLRS
jgi:hypothetical protein